jgi:crotonobetainyl-CoA:carnitine CoA-transferase CaiB-like acyl-CoA transferase
MTLPLQGLRLVDLSRQLPGPYCSMLLADLGMDVVTVVAPNDAMGVGIPLLQRNKRNVTLNLKDSRGLGALHRLVDRSDVLLEGFRPGVTQRLGVDYATLRERNPRLIYCSISGYGQDGPYRDKVGHDINYLGYAGVLEVTGPAGGPPIIPGVQIADIGGGALMAAIGILTAVVARQTTGRGQFVDISMMDGSVAFNVFHAMLRFLMGRNPTRGASQLTGNNPCYAIYETRDEKYVTVGAIEPHFWRNLCQTLGLAELAERQFEEGEGRESTFERVRGKFREKTQAEWLAIFEGVDICFGPVNSLAEMEDNPQVRHREMVVTIDGQQRALGIPIKLSDTPGSIRLPPATFGQHTAEVLAEVGYSAAEIADFQQSGVV